MRPILAAGLLTVALAACGSGDSTEKAALTESQSATTAPSATAAATETPEETPIVEETQAEEPAAESPDELYPDVLDVRATQAGDGSWSFDVTLSSPYDSTARYADGWRILTPDGTELGVRVLAHDHAGEQPFTRSLSSVEIPDDVDLVIVEGRDQVNGWGGATVEVTLER